MSAELKRYDIYFHSDDVQFLKECEDGDYVKHSDISDYIRDAMRYRWVRAAGAFDSEIGLNDLSENPEKYDAAVDAAMERRK